MGWNSKLGFCRDDFAQSIDVADWLHSFNQLHNYNDFIFLGQFIFDGTNPGAIPDILFAEYEDFDPEFDDITSLSKWDNENEDSLLLAVKQIVRLVNEIMLFLHLRANFSYNIFY